jgi:nuclear receptor-binding protein
VSISDSISDEVLHRHYGPENVVAEIRHRRGSDDQCIQYRMSDVPVSEKLEKFVEDVK